MDLREVRSLVITALFSDDDLVDILVLKGGNALDIVYKIGSRSSVDIDLSMAGDFGNLEDAKARIFRSLMNGFEKAGYVMFDEKFETKPSVFGSHQNPQWGGYQITFKIISKEVYEEFEGNIEVLRRRAETIGPAEQRKFKIDISKFEFCTPKLEAELGNHIIYVYSLSMLAIEKLRAICQQMSEYELRSYATPRARDFLDIYTIGNAGLARVVSPENVELLRSIFAAKNVPISLLDRVEEYREFHRPDWDAVIQTSSDDLEEFDFYFDYVLVMIEGLKAMGIEDSPA